MIDLLAAGLTCFLLLAGAVLSLIAALGIFRMPDLYTRMQAAAKTATLGVGCTILALAIHFGDTSVTMHAVLVIIFLFLTGPVAAHMIARAGYISGIELWEGSVVDEMSSRYHRVPRHLASHDVAQPDAAAAPPTGSVARDEPVGDDQRGRGTPE